MIGGSDAGALLGLDGKYRSPVTIYYETLGIKKSERKMNEVMLHGKLLEEYIAGLWEYWDGDSDKLVENYYAGARLRKQKEYKFIAVNPSYPYLFANIDRIVTKHPFWGKTKGVLEIKTIRSEISDQYINGIPPKYIAQCQQYMMVFGMDYAEVAFLKDGRSLNVVEFTADKEMQQAIAQVSAEHNARVESAMSAFESYARKYGTLTEQDALDIAMEFEPDADGLYSTEQFFSERHKNIGARMEILGDDSMRDAAINYVSWEQREKEAAEQKLYWRTVLQQNMQKNKANSMVFLDGGSVKWNKIFKVKM